MKPLVSILIPAYNAEEWIAETIRSAIAQTWPRKEVIVVDDGSCDRTREVAQAFASKEVKVVTKENEGAAAARDHAWQLSQGDYIQWLDADDLLAPDKIQRQLSALRESDSKKVLLSSSWAHFAYRYRRAVFVPTRLWQDLSPVEWLLRKMGENLHMQTATWLTSRELTAAAGPWDRRLSSDDDGEYFCRVLLESKGTRFVSDARVFYRLTTFNRWSYISPSDNKKKDSLLISMKLHIQYLQSLEKSERVRKACLAYLQTKCIDFFPERHDIVKELHEMAKQFQGCLEEPRLSWKYSWMRPVFGWQVAKWAMLTLPGFKSSLIRQWDKAMYRLESDATTNGQGVAEVAQKQ